jgi:hypothetical protein
VSRIVTRAVNNLLIRGSEAKSELDLSRATGIGCPQEDLLRSFKTQRHIIYDCLPRRSLGVSKTLDMSVLLMRGHPSIRIIAWKIFVSHLSVAGASSPSFRPTLVRIFFYTLI